MAINVDTVMQFNCIPVGNSKQIDVKRVYAMSVYPIITWNLYNLINL